MPNNIGGNESGRNLADILSVNTENNYVTVGPLINAMRFRNNNNRNPLFNVRDRLFHTLFFRAALAYARTVPLPIRRFIEFMILIKAILAFFILMYIHLAFTKAPVTCLDDIKNTWPRDGILRVEVLTNPEVGYSLGRSFSKNHKIKPDKVEDFTSFLGFVVRDTFANVESTLDEDTKQTEPLHQNYNNQSEVIENKINMFNFLPSSTKNLSDSVAITTKFDGLQDFTKGYRKIMLENLEGDGISYENQSTLINGLVNEVPTEESIIATDSPDGEASGKTGKSK